MMTKRYKKCVNQLLLPQEIIRVPSKAVESLSRPPAVGPFALGPGSWLDSRIPSGNLTVCYANSPWFMGKLQLYGHVKWQTATDYQRVSFMIYQQFSNSAIQFSLIKLQRAMRAMMSPSTIGVSRCFKGTSWTWITLNKDMISPLKDASIVNQAVITVI